MSNDEQVSVTHEFTVRCSRVLCVAVSFVAIVLVSHTGKRATAVSSE